MTTPARKLLWVDDDTVFAHLAGNYFRLWGLDVDVTPRCPEQPGDVLQYQGLVWDHTFAGTDDQTFLRNLRREALGKQFPILLLYSREITLDERLFFNEHTIRHSPKWTSLWNLLQKVQEIVD